MSSKTKLHELLAVEESLNTVLADAIKEATGSFANKEHLFKGHIIKVEPLEESVDGYQPIASQTEQMDVAETVPGKLAFVFNHLAKAFNVYGRKEATNQNAVADLIVNGEVLIPDCPATMLLGLETRLKHIRAMVLAIKTSDQSKGWEPTDVENVYQARPEVRHVTKKVQRQVVVIEPTEHQAGQYSEYAEDVRVGEKTTIPLSGLVSPKEKSDILARVDTLLRAAKKARQRANGAEVDTKFSPGKAIRDFLLNGVIVDDGDA